MFKSNLQRPLPLTFWILNLKMDDNTCRMGVFNKKKLVYCISGLWSWVPSRSFFSSQSLLNPPFLALKLYRPCHNCNFQDVAFTQTIQESLWINTKKDENRRNGISILCDASLTNNHFPFLPRQTFKYWYLASRLIGFSVNFPPNYQLVIRSSKFWAFFI